MKPISQRKQLLLDLAAMREARDRAEDAYQNEARQHRSTQRRLKATQGVVTKLKNQLTALLGKG
jgi:hypothetical protein